MTAGLMHEKFKRGLDKADSLNTPNFLAEEIDGFLNDAQEKFIEQRAYGTNPKRTGLEEDQKRRDDLREITKNYTNSSTLSSTVNSKPNGVFVDLPEDYRHAMQEEVSISFTDCNDLPATDRIPATAVTHDRYNKIIDDPFNKPYVGEALRLDYEGDVYELITDGTYSITNYHLRYLKEPQAIRFGTAYEVVTTDVDSELAAHTHREVTDIAVKDALEDIESKRYATSKQELVTVE